MVEVSVLPRSALSCQLIQVVKVMGYHGQAFGGESTYFHINTEFREGWQCPCGLIQHFRRSDVDFNIQDKIDAMNGNLNLPVFDGEIPGGSFVVGYTVSCFQVGQFSTNLQWAIVILGIPAES